ncbi:nucleotidyltransferase family protein [Paenibacillus sp. FSL K6-1230]|uniref:nucleotidyltransferase family protein n=1 Tax=Paenibacillus sp. FSL K6-1230 TaxID=2921603 RepID=UPI0030F8BDDB
MSVTGVILAAGRSSRLGRDKLAELLLDGRSIGARVVDTALNSRLDHVLVVGRQCSQPDWLTSIFDEALRQDRAEYLHCTKAGTGMSASLQCGLEGAIRRGAQAIMILLADQPFVQESSLDALLQLYDDVYNFTRPEQSFDYIAARNGASPQPPVILTSTMYEAVRQLQGDCGAGILLKSARYRGIYCDYSADLFMDADTETALMHLREQERRVMSCANE